MSGPIPSLDRLSVLESESGYRENFLNLELWRPYVLEVCRRHGLAPSLPLQAGASGTYPVFIAGVRWVIKFFGRQFNGEQSFQGELALTSRVMELAEFPAPAVVAQGELFPHAKGWRWPYLVLEYLPGVSFAEIGSILGQRVRLQLAGELGELARRLHTVTAPNWAPYLDFLAAQRTACRQRLAGWGWMPPTLLDQLDDFLPPVEELIDPGEQPHWIHMDITREHLIGRWDHGDWTTLGLIDFGDGQVGSLYFELPALHLDFFNLDGRLLATFLDAYGYPYPQDDAFRRKALAACLLHPLDVLGPVWERYLRPNPPPDLTQLAVRLWSPGPVTG